MNLTQACDSWERALGPGRVFNDAATLERYGRTTLPSAPQPAAVVRARSREDVLEIVAIARECGVPLYPISRGKNWGYGDACPVGEGQVILDLSEMNRIAEVNAELAYAVVEPGVSQRELADHLRAHDVPLWLDCAGTTPEASLVGNVLERGFGRTPFSDHYLGACGMEVVLADGTLVQTGLGHFPDAKAKHVFKWGVGPSIDGLFTQSNFGIVVSLAVSLMPKPERARALMLTVEDDDKLELLVDRLRPLRLGGILQSPAYIWNDMRVISHRRRYPHAEAGGRTPVPPQLVRQLRDSFATRVGSPMNGAWNVMAPLYGTRGQVKVAARAVKQAVGEFGRLSFLAPETIELADRAASVLARLGSKRADDLRGVIALARPGVDVLCGQPTTAALAGCRWRVRELRDPESMDPLDNNCGFFWLSPVCPAVGGESRRVVELLRTTLTDYGFDPLLTIVFLQQRALVVPAMLAYDRSDPEETARASECHDVLFDALLDAGYPPYRVTTRDMGRLDAHGSTYWQLVARLKQALDPDGIIAPGRYAPHEIHTEPLVAG